MINLIVEKKKKKDAESNVTICQEQKKKTMNGKQDGVVSVYLLTREIAFVKRSDDGNEMI